MPIDDIVKAKRALETLKIEERLSEIENKQIWTHPAGGGGSLSVETDPIFGASEAALLESGDKAKIDSALQSETDPIFSASEAASFVAGDAAKLLGIEAGAEVNNISDVNATDLTDAGATTLHKHDHGGMDGLTDDDHTQYLTKSPTTTARNTITAQSATVNPLTLKAAAAQSENVFQATDSSGNNFWRITSAGQWIYGNPLALGAQQIGVFQDANYAQLFYQCSSDDTAHNNSFYFRRSRGTNQAATTVGNGDGVFSILGLARGASAFVPSFLMQVKVEGTPSGGTVPVYYDLLVGQTAATTVSRQAVHATNALGGMVFNETGADYDFRVEGDTITNLFHLKAASPDGIGIGIDPTARLHLMAGTATAGTAPLKLTLGVSLTAAEAGAVEWDGANLFITQTTGPTRKTIAYTSDITGTNSGINTGDQVGDGTTITGAGTVADPFVAAGGASGSMPVYGADGTQYLIALISGQVPVYGADGTQYLIALV